MEKRNKYILLVFLGVSCFSLLFIFNSLLLNNPQSPIIQNEEERAVKQYSVDNITLIIDYSGVQTNEKFENVSLTNYQTTVYLLLLNCCEITIQNYGLLIYVTEINSVPNWIYTVNNEPLSNIAANYFNLLDNDTVKWKHV
ncbi:MAG: hypothetical protein KGD72_03525 [Candidatus Lokiarchaeota archaeon]|nr:hypothetical protein [Candidatus Lokiarchaeota archaeon]